MTGSGHLVVIGVGGIGLAVARRLGAGRPVVVADRSTEQLESAVELLRAEGFDVAGHGLDVTDAGAVDQLASRLAEVGPVTTVVHTAGVSPAQADSAAIYRVDLLGVAHVIDAFAPLVATGASVVVVASMAGQLAGLADHDERALATTPTAQLLDLDVVRSTTDPAAAYLLAKRGAQLRVQAAAGRYGARGARINSVSPGVIATAMSAAELASPYGDTMRLMLDAAPIARIGAPDDIAAAIGFLSSDDASYVTGADLLVDGGVVSTKWSAQG
jgi:NAD(P)-dependent dehydrogenase (short-subunit alcohol dehydrogenase family)